MNSAAARRPCRYGEMGSSVKRTIQSLLLLSMVGAGSGET
jgi:hypothetical protein